MQAIQSGAVLITGSSGLIGTALCRSLKNSGETVIEFDQRINPQWDICQPDARHTLWPELLRGVRGVIHLAAVSRVVTGQQNPAKCWQTNVFAIDELTHALENTASPPWLILASSREVYGQPSQLPAADTSPIAPLNVYAASKASGELLANHYRQRSGAPVAIVRFSSVYGAADDHIDRVVPAFARAAAFGQRINVHGADTTLDITHLSDITPALMTLISRLDKGDVPERPLLLSSGKGTRLIELAEMASGLADSPLEITITDYRNYDVSRFIGSPDYAREYLGWNPSSVLSEGFRQLMRDMLAQSKL